MTLQNRPTSLVYAASDRKHRPASHPVYGGLPRFDVEPLRWMLTGENIRRRREARHLSQKDVADALGVTRVAIALWESNRTVPSPAHAERLREVLA